MLTDSYVFDRETRVWLPSGESSPIPFTDGTQIEQRLTGILTTVTDRSSTSQELLSEISDWPTAYHLSPYRSNLLRPIEHLLKGSVLELGAGCGGVSRYIGEVSRRHVAVEGSLERAKICALRCADLPNVTVVCDRIEHLPRTEKFSVVTLIGVLEYARAFTGWREAEDPIQQLLRAARELLLPGGALVVAIENQLGLKYFAGSKEDHLNKEWAGIGDSYTQSSAVTFGKRELQKHLQVAGFQHTKFLLPVPDYKLPVSVVNGELLERAGDLRVDIASLFTQGQAVDMNQAAQPLFPLETTWQVVARNGLLADLSNSFLVIAQGSATPDPRENVAMFHYGVSRRKELQKETTIELAPAGGFRAGSAVVKRRPLYGAPRESTTHRYDVVWTDEPVSEGDLFVSGFFKVVNADEWSVQSIVQWATPWIRFLESHSSPAIAGGEPPLYSRHLPNNFLDATPFNLLRKPSGELVAIDLEWVDREAPSLLHVLVRGLLGCFDRVSSVAFPRTGTPLDHYSLVVECLAAYGFRCTQGEIDRVLREEAAFRSWVSGVPVTLTSEQLVGRKLNPRALSRLLSLADARGRVEHAIGAEGEGGPPAPGSIADSVRRVLVERRSAAAEFVHLVESERVQELAETGDVESRLKDATIAIARSQARLREKARSIKVREIAKPSAVRTLGGLVGRYGTPVARRDLRNNAHSIKFLIGEKKAARVWRVITQSGLFDYEYYARTNPDLRGYEDDLLMHYIRSGAAEGRQPNALFDGRWYSVHHRLQSLNPLLHYSVEGARLGFDPHPLFLPSWYRSQFPEGESIENPLAHYLRIGAPAGISPHPLFDVEFYLTQLKEPLAPGQALQHFLERWSDALPDPHQLFDLRYYVAQNPDIARSGTNPLVHYLLHGGSEGRDPCREFSSRGYLSLNQDVLESGTNPLLHFVLYGIHEGRRACSVPRDEERSTVGRYELPGNQKLSAVEPLLDSFAPLTARSEPSTSGAEPRVVDVIIPVYKGKAETLRCIYSVLEAATGVPFRLIVVNDCTPDAGLGAVLRELAAAKKFVLLDNPKNLGFVGSVNRGMSYGKTPDILLLNSDTEVFDGWLDRLVKAAYSKSQIGTVTPLSNSATICSYPHWCQDTPFRMEVSPEEIDSICSSVNHGRYLEIPTAVGFCMYIKRECFAEVGEFDLQKFGKGYCEENDFCLRALDRGWKHVLTTDTYVLHYGSTSFGGERNERVAASLETIRREYPNYERDVSEHIRRDPSFPDRLAVDIERLHRSLLPRRFVFACHVRGGGTSRHMQDLERELERQRVSVLYLEPGDAGMVSIRHSVHPSGYFPTLASIDFRRKPYLLSLCLRALGVEHAHVHSLIDFDLDAPIWLREAFGLATISYDFTLHDYGPICPRVNMIDDSLVFCGGVEEQKCQRCVEKNNSVFGLINVAAWRDRNKSFLEGARSIYGPSSDVILRTQSVVPGANYIYRRHPESEGAPLDLPLDSPSPDRDTRTVGIIGAIGPHKGSRLVYACALDAVERKLPLRFKIIGYADNQRLLETLPNITWTGPYDDSQIDSLVRAAGLDIAWFPAVWPETFSYTLSVALRLGTYPVAFDMGAIAERIRVLGRGSVLPLELLNNPGAINDWLCRIDISSHPPSRETVATYHDVLEQYYERKSH